MQTELIENRIIDILLRLSDQLHNPNQKTVHFKTKCNRLENNPRKLPIGHVSLICRGRGCAEIGDTDSGIYCHEPMYTETQENSSTYTLGCGSDVNKTTTTRAICETKAHSPNTLNHNRHISSIEDDPSSTLQQAELLFRRYVTSGDSTLPASTTTTSSYPFTVDESSETLGRSLLHALPVSRSSLQNMKVSVLPVDKENVATRSIETQQKSIPKRRLYVQLDRPAKTFQKKRTVQGSKANVIFYTPPQWESVEPVFCPTAQKIAADIATGSTLEAVSVPITQGSAFLVQPHQDASVQTECYEGRGERPTNTKTRGTKDSDQFSVITNKWLKNLVARLQKISTMCHPMTDVKLNVDPTENIQATHALFLGPQAPYRSPEAVGSRCLNPGRNQCSPSGSKAPGDGGDRSDSKQLKRSASRYDHSHFIMMKFKELDDSRGWNRKQIAKRNAGCPNLRSQSLRRNMNLQSGPEYHRNCTPRNRGTVDHVGVKPTSARQSPKSQSRMRSPQILLTDATGRMRQIPERDSVTSSHSRHTGSLTRRKASKSPWR